MTDITIPPDTEEKVAQSICDAEFWPGMWASLDKESNEVVVYRKQARAACLAMLKAWPGMGPIRTDQPIGEWCDKLPAIILPLPQEASDD